MRLTCFGKLTAIAACVLIVLAFSKDSDALEFSVHPNNSQSLNAIFASGDVEQGDTEKLGRFLQGLSDKKNTAIYLSSPGGSLYEGMRLGRYFTANKIKTVVEGGHDCASACALAFLGGRDRKGNPWRSSSDNSRLGFHAFSTPGQGLEDSNQTQRVVSDVLSYGQDVDAPLEVLIINFATPSHEIYWLSFVETCSLGIKLWSNTYNKFLCK